MTDHPTALWVNELDELPCLAWAEGDPLAALRADTTNRLELRLDAPGLDIELDPNAQSLGLHLLDESETRGR